MRKVFRTTVGRFWGYVSILIALGVSLAGNVTAAYLHDKNPSWVDLGFAGIPPLVAFLSVEVVNHNPWAANAWGRYVRAVLLGVVTPASAIVSFIHLTTVVITGRVHDDSPEGVLNWITAVLTALLIDGLMIGGTAALLLPKAVSKVNSVPEPAAPIGAIEAYPNWRDELERLAAQFTPQTDLGPIIQEMNDKIAALAVQARPARAAKSPASKAKTPPVIAATLAAQPTEDVKDRTRWPIGEHPLWDAWLKARGTKDEWTPEKYAQRSKEDLDRDISPAAAQTAIGRWEKALKEKPELLQPS